MQSFKTRRLGKSGVPVSELGFGGAGLGELFTRVDEKTAAATLEAAWDVGIRYFDTAPFYGSGLSEIRTGRLLDNRPRGEFILSSKVGRWFFPPANPDAFQPSGWAGGLRFDHVHDYTYDGIMHAYEQSHMRLGMNRIDLLVIHDLDFWFHKTEKKVNAYLDQLFTSGWRALAELRAHGLVRGIGAGINELGMIPRFLDLVDLDFFLLALRYTLMEHETLAEELPACQRHDVGIVIGGVYSSGITATGPVPGAKYNYADATPDVMEKARSIEAVCRAHGVPLAAAALQFPLGHPSVASVIPGAIHPDHVRKTVENFNHAIPASLWSDLKAEGLIAKDAPTPA
ncbi:aldo/keto reductase [Arvimicrobium flavum]|uniref:aldo/keto reductase n=1 Tax=Arvimicrobium flavum TaxID=3393320 RepID=UPI00237A8CDC|nr:aldo/keto reductase [Mesorhizobium shangrilense]